jgi:hypothetical protein
MLWEIMQLRRLPWPMNEDGGNRRRQGDSVGCRYAGEESSGPFLWQRATYGNEPRCICTPDDDALFGSTPDRMGKRQGMLRGDSRGSNSLEGCCRYINTIFGCGRTMDVNPVTLAFNLRLVSQKTAKNTIFKYSNFKY